jgi:hypothetical protein
VLRQELVVAGAFRGPCPAPVAALHVISVVDQAGALVAFTAPNGAAGYVGFVLAVTRNVAFQAAFSALNHLQNLRFRAHYLYWLNQHLVFPETSDYLRLVVRTVTGSTCLCLCLCHRFAIGDAMRRAMALGMA